MAQWTDEQRRAIEQTGDVSVSAAAGSGKTTVLTERIARIVEQGTDVKKLLVVTFTNAAASEMKRRIAKRLASAAANASGERAVFLRAQAEDVGEAQISTIHAFCGQLIRRNFFLAGLDPAFRVANDTQSALLKTQAMDETLALSYDENDPLFSALLNAMGGEEKFIERADALYEQMMAMPEPFTWLNGAVEAYALSEAGLYAHPATREIFENLRYRTRAQIGNIEKARGLCDGMQSAQRALDDDLMRLRALLALEEKDYRAAVLAMQYMKMTFPKGADNAVKKRVQDLRQRLKDEYARQKKVFTRPLAEEAEKQNAQLPVMRRFAAFLKAYDETYAAMKRAAGVIDFSDMERLALTVLGDPAVQAACREKYEYVFMDEYQDCNRVQEEIIGRVCRQGRRFLVGDVKQSIYGFRQAEPELFLKKLETGGAGVVRMRSNFRSAPCILDAVNGVFERIMKKEHAGFDYAEEDRLVGGNGENAAYAGVEMHVIDTRAGEDETDEIDEIAADVREALLCAKRIRELREEAHIPYGDMAVLLRRKKNAGLWAQTLATEGIPCHAQLAGGYFDALEVQVFLNLLRVIDNRRQDIPFLSVLLSAIGGFTEKDMAYMRANYPAPSCIESLSLWAENEPRAAAFLDRLHDWRRQARYVDVEALIAFLYEETGYYDYVGALPGGGQRQANLDALLTHAQTAGKEDVGAFLKYMDGARDNAAVAPAQTGAADVVHILTIHKSKGLEYPVVFLCGMGQRFNVQGPIKPLLMDAELGLGVKYIDGGARRRQRDTWFRQAIAARLRRKETGEEMRVLYVGMTRAKHRLVIVGSLPDAQPRAPETMAQCPMDWLMETIPVKRHARAEFSAQEDALRPLPTPMADAAVTERFSWVYPFMDAARLRSKVSVSMLEETEEKEWAAPRFARAEETGGAARGSAAHEILHCVPLKGAHDEETLRAFAKELVLQKKIPDSAEKLVNYRNLEKFFSTPLAMRLCAAKDVRREMEFACPLPARMLFGDETEENVLLQGVIDACFIEGGAWVLIDYKTDSKKTGLTVREAAERHRGQLTLYAQALEKLTGMEVKERWVCMLSFGENILL